MPRGNGSLLDLPLDTGMHGLLSDGEDHGGAPKVTAHDPGVKAPARWGRGGVRTATDAAKLWSRLAAWDRGRPLVCNDRPKYRTGWTGDGSVGVEFGAPGMVSVSQVSQLHVMTVNRAAALGYLIATG